MPSSKRVTCKFCGKENILVKMDRTLRAHKGQDRLPCEGSNTTPTETGEPDYASIRSGR
jgi:hypothetical protein